MAGPEYRKLPRNKLLLNALRAFEAAGRHMSMQEAAEELTVTHGAISRHIRNLENSLGTELFVRNHRQITLSLEGEYLLQVATETMERISEGILKLSEDTMSGRLSIACTESLAAGWLIPLMEDFLAMHPSTEIQFTPIDVLNPEKLPEADIAIVAGPRKLHEKRVVFLRKVDFFPVCSPAYAQDTPLLRRPRDLCRLNLPLLHDDDGTLWKRWFDAINEKLDHPSNNHYYASGNLAMTAARSGYGVVLGQSLDAVDDIKHGRLVRLFKRQLPAPDPYYLVTSNDPVLPLRVTEFERWLRAKVGSMSDDY